MGCLALNTAHLSHLSAFLDIARLLVEPGKYEPANKLCMQCRYALAWGVPVVSAAWLEASIAAGFPAVRFNARQCRKI